MADEVFMSVAEDIGNMDGEINRVKDLLDGARQAGEDVAEMEKDLKLLLLRREKWIRMLKARGIDIPKGGS